MLYFSMILPFFLYRIYANAQRTFCLYTSLAAVRCPVSRVAPTFVGEFTVDVLLHTSSKCGGCRLSFYSYPFSPLLDRPESCFVSRISTKNRFKIIYMNWVCRSETLKHVVCPWWRSDELLHVFSFQVIISLSLLRGESLERNLMRTLFRANSCQGGVIILFVAMPVVSYSENCASKAHLQPVVT